MHVVNKLLQVFAAARTLSATGCALARPLHATKCDLATRTGRAGSAGMRATRTTNSALCGATTAALFVAAITSGLAGRAWAQASTQHVGWGYNSYGQINTPSTATNVTQVACGEYHTYAL